MRLATPAVFRESASVSHAISSRGNSLYFYSQADAYQRPALHLNNKFLHCNNGYSEIHSAEVNSFNSHRLLVFCITNNIRSNLTLQRMGR